jgi:hypothetical protein
MLGHRTTRGSFFRSGRPRLANQRRHDLRQRASVPVNRIAHPGPLLAPRLQTLLRLMRRPRGRRHGLSHRHPLAISAQHPNLLGPKSRYRLGHGSRHRLKARHRLRDPPPPLQHCLDLRRGALHRQPLIPIWQPIGELARRQTQARLPRHGPGPLPFAGALDYPLPLKGPQDRLISPAMGARPSAPHASLARSQRDRAARKNPC